MKKVNLKGNLTLKKETIEQLDNNQMEGVKGGKIAITSISKHCTHAHNGCYGTKHSRGWFCNPH